MPPRRPVRSAPPDIDALRSALERGKIVRVGIAPSGQFPDGVTGRVRSIGDPATDGEEYVMVQVPVGGSKDVLPFAPGDLLSAPVRRSPAGDRAGAPGTAPRSVGSRDAPKPGSGSATDSTEDELFPAPVRAVAAPAPAATAPTSTPEAARPGNRKAVAPRTKRPPVTITIATAGDESAVWRLDVRIGARTAVRPTVVPPSRVWEIVESLGDDKVSGVVKSLLDDHRRATQARADALAAQLSLLQDELRLFPGAGE